jgi:general secretion pathway protein A
MSEPGHGLANATTTVVRDSAPASGALYAEHFKLSAQPFSLTPDPAFLYLGPAHREALAAVEYGLIDRRGFITLMGEVGTGKTTLLYSLLGRLGPEFQVAYVTYTHQSVRRLLTSVLKDLGIPAPGTSKAALILALNRHLRRRGEEGGTTAIVIDEAQNLSDEAFEQLRLLSNFETYTQKLIQIVLVGQPELQDRLRQPQLRQLWERVSVRSVMNPLPDKEMRRYIEHRLQAVGGRAPELFTPRALRLIIRRAAGIPRRANILCHNALLFAYGRSLPRVTAHIAREAIAEMDGRRRLLPRAGLRRRSGVARWIFAAAAVTVALVAIRPLRSSPPAVVVTAEPPETSPPAVPPPVHSEAVATDPTPPPPADELPGGAALEEAAPPAALGPPAAVTPPTAAAAPLSVTVPRGAHLLALAREIYGQDLRGAKAAEFLAEVRRLNPQMKDPNVLLAGELLMLPPALAGLPGPVAPSIP